VRFLILSLIALAGCVATLPDDPTISADLACEVARAVVQLRAAPDATPDNKPKPGDKCPNCDGRGYVGDGTVKVKCQPCEGTGRVK
jgi:poly(3-hydroxybutyrate) depolymerase